MDLRGLSAHVANIAVFATKCPGALDAEKSMSTGNVERRSALLRAKCAGEGSVGLFIAENALMLLALVEIFVALDGELATETALQKTPRETARELTHVNNGKDRNQADDDQTQEARARHKKRISASRVAALHLRTRRKPPFVRPSLRSLTYRRQPGREKGPRNGRADED